MGNYRQMKWVIDNLGITREAVKYYESKGLISPHRDRDSNNRRIFDDEDLERLWTVKLLIEVGYTADEILAMGESEFDFMDSITEKAAQLEREIESKKIGLSFAKTIKLTGQIPNVRNIGDMKFQDFIEYSRKNWNFAEDDEIAEAQKAASALDVLKSESLDNLSDSTLDRLADIFEPFEKYDEAIVLSIRVQAITDTLVAMAGLDPNSEAVQRTLNVLYEEMKGMAPEGLTKDQFARFTAWGWDDCDLGQRNRAIYGAEVCDFVFNSLMCFSSNSLAE